MLVFVMLARLLSPEDYGLASSAFLVLSFLALLAELGFGDAIVQARDLEANDLNLLLYASLAFAVLLAVTTALLSTSVAAWLGVPRLAPYILGSAALCPLTVLAGFQEALYRRGLKFRQLALRTLAGVGLGGLTGVLFAWIGLGTWALIAQFSVQLAVGLVWLWARSSWRPSLALNPESFRRLGSFGLNVVGMRIVDFVTLRSVDIIILAVYGPAALGLFSVSSRLYQLLMQLFQASISSVGLTVLSQVSDDKARMSRLFERSCSISAMAGLPVFVGLAALAPEVNLVMFGTQWHGADQVMKPLLLVGGLHCIQFTLGAYLIALGRPRTLLHLMLLKAMFVLPPLYLCKMASVASLATLFACVLAAETPFIFAATLRSLGLPWTTLLRPVGLPLLTSGLCFGGIELVRHSATLPGNDFARSALLGFLFFAGNALLTLLLARDIALVNIAFLRQATRR